MFNEKMYDYLTSGSRLIWTSENLGINITEKIVILGARR
jgi:hypothetical protein